METNLLLQLIAMPEEQTKQINDYLDAQTKYLKEKGQTSKTKISIKSEHDVTGRIEIAG